tara:strand:- start:428 stop:769 length:342 start_codon:yes stop_codon:yes gene_type:complete
MSITSKVRQSVVLGASGQIQKLINTASTSTATNITKANIMNVFAQASDADAEIKIYNEIGSNATASKLIFHGKFATAANQVHEFKLPGAGIYADTGMYVVLANIDFFYVVGTF